MSSLEKITEDFYKTGISICDDLITKHESRLLLAEIQKEQKSLQKAGIGSGENLQVNAEKRGDFIKWINEGEENVFTRIYLAKLKIIMESFNKKFFLGLQKSEHHITYYPAATRYEKHVDTFKASEARVVSTVLYLNKNWEIAHGGELCIYPENGPTLKVAPSKGAWCFLKVSCRTKYLRTTRPVTALQAGLNAIPFYSCFLLIFVC